MISFVTSLLLVSAASDSTPPAPVVAKVAAAVGAAWGVPEERVRLTWGLMPPNSIAADASVRLAGTGGNGWYVAVVGTGAQVLAIRVRAGMEESVTVAAMALTPGHRLLDSDIRREQRVRFGPPDSSSAPIGAGWLVRRVIPEGTMLATPLVAPPAAVHAGETVRMVWRQGAVEVEINGTALHDAALGEPLRARGPSKETLLGRVTAPGEATMERGPK